MFEVYMYLKFYNIPGFNDYYKKIIDSGNYLPFYFGIQNSNHILTGLSPYYLICFPYGFILLSIIFYNYAKIYSKDTKGSALLTIFIIFSYTYTKTLSVGYVSSLSFPIIIHICTLLYQILNRENVIRNCIIVLVELFFLVGTWHSAAFLGLFLFIAFSISSFVVSIILKVYLKNKTKKDINNVEVNVNYILKMSSIQLLLSIFLSIITLFAKKDMLMPYILRYKELFFASGENIFNKIFSLFEPIILRLLGKSKYSLIEQSLSYDYTSTIEGKFYFICFIILNLIVLLFSLYSLKINIKKALSKNLDLIIITISILLAQIFFYIAYLASAVNSSYIIILLPVLCYTQLRKLEKKNIQNFFITTILILSFLMLIFSGITYRFGNLTQTTYEENSSALDWIHSNIEKSSIIFADFNMYSRILKYEILHNLSNYFIINHITSLSYKYIIGLEKPTQNFKGSYVILDIASLDAGMKIQTYEGRGVLENYLSEINLNPNLSLIYNDGIIGVYQFIM
ncbi:MAG: hypothetical protein ACTSPW_10325 [Promethearchaeota archaeon]